MFSRNKRYFRSISISLVLLISMFLVASFQIYCLSREEWPVMNVNANWTFNWVPYHRSLRWMVTSSITSTTAPRLCCYKIWSTWPGRRCDTRSIPRTTIALIDRLWSRSNSCGRDRSFSWLKCAISHTHHPPCSGWCDRSSKWSFNRRTWYSRGAMPSVNYPSSSHAGCSPPPWSIKCAWSMSKVVSKDGTTTPSAIRVAFHPAMTIHHVHVHIDPWRTAATHGHCRRQWLVPSTSSSTRLGPRATGANVWIGEMFDPPPCSTGTPASFVLKWSSTPRMIVWQWPSSSPLSNTSGRRSNSRSTMWSVDNNRKWCRTLLRHFHLLCFFRRNWSNGQIT